MMPQRAGGRLAPPRPARRLPCDTCGVQRINIASPEFTYDATDPDGFRAGMVRLGRLFGASRIGASVYELPPGESICPYHYEHGEEEMLFVLVGCPSLRTPEGVTALGSGDVVFFPTGPAGAHAVFNEGTETARVLMISNVRFPNVTVYPDSDKLGVWVDDRDDDLLVHRDRGVDYWSGEAGRARSDG